MTALPLSYFVAVALLGGLLIHGLAQLRTAWAFPYNAALATVGAWYLIEPVYFADEFYYLNPAYVRTAFDCVVIYLVTFALMTPVLVRWLQPKYRSPTLGGHVAAERILRLVVGAWLFLLGYGVARLHGDILSALFPVGGRGGGNMWGRAAAAGAGDDGFIVSTASYVYVLCLASFGILLFLVRAPGYRLLAVALILISWPYAFLQGSRNITLAVVVPFAISYLLFSRQGKLTKAALLGVSFFALDLALRVIIRYRAEGFSDVDLSQAEGAAHLGLNMASELVYSVEFIQRGILQLSYGAIYLQEVASIIPRALWPGKPLVGIDYAVARGFGGGDGDLGVFATVSSGMIGQGVQNFGVVFGPITTALLMGLWVAILARFRQQGSPARAGLFLVGLGITFNLGRDITMLVLWPIVFGYLGVRIYEWKWPDRAARPVARRPGPTFPRYSGATVPVAVARRPLQEDAPSR